MKFVVGTILLAIALAACTGSPPPYSPALGLSNQSVARGATADAAVRAWSRGLIRVPLPNAGCFEASYPALAWSRVACTTARLPISRNRAIGPATVGDGRDFFLSVSPLLISTATGSFPQVTGVTRVKSVGVKSLGGVCVCGNDAYTLQLNSNFYQTTTACGKNVRCIGWEQLAFANPVTQKEHIGQLFIQDWRITTNKTALKCPPPKSGWRANGGDCYYSSNAIDIPKIPIAQLADLSLTLSVASSGDSAFFSVGKTVYGMKDLQGDFMELSRNWTGAEFNVIGDCCDSRAVFNPGSTITASLEADDGSTAAPICESNRGTTGETNSLSFVAAPANAPEQQNPSILFTESNTAGGGSASCDTLAGL
jgi:hypothetical protein